MPGSIYHSALRDKRLYLFPGEEQKQEFVANSAKYANVDLAMEGKCAVCRVEMNQDVPGNAEFAAYYQGMRYLFPGDDQRKMFLANPAKYAIAPARPAAVDGVQATPPSTEQLVSVRGKSGCAGCEFGVSPLGNPKELGLALKSADGKVYVVEKAHELYPKVYEDRFDGLQLSVRGSILKRDGKVAWITPTDLKVIN
jgi:YHS domain-containing protein